SLTGLSILATMLISFLIYSAWMAKKAIWKFSIIGLSLIIGLLLVGEMKEIYHEYYATKPYPVNVDDRTAEGHFYTFDFSSSDLENGYPVWVYMCDEELRREWN